MADCLYCKHAIIHYGEFWDCKLDEYAEPDEECENYEEYTAEDDYWDKYAYEERYRDKG